MSTRLSIINTSAQAERLSANTMVLWNHMIMSQLGELADEIEPIQNGPYSEE
jgi:hypothetical protein